MSDVQQVWCLGWDGSVRGYWARSDALTGHTDEVEIFESEDDAVAGDDFADIYYGESVFTDRHAAHRAALTYFIERGVGLGLLTTTHPHGFYLHRALESTIAYFCRDR